MDNVRTALKHIDRSMSDWDQRPPIPFQDFLREVTARPTATVRNIFQVFHDLVHSHISEGRDEYPDDPESIHFSSYDCSRLFVEGTDHPFFADRLFANRLINLVRALKRGAQQNKIYIFEGPHGSGKSTFLNNLLGKLEQYANTEEGALFETIWRIDRRLLGDFQKNQAKPFLDKLTHLLDEYEFSQADLNEAKSTLPNPDYLEIPCPSHDHPLLQIPKELRRAFFDDLFANAEIKWRLFTEKEYDWLFRDSPCTICGSLYQALLRRLKSPAQVLDMVYVRPYHFNRRISDGISVFNPGDKPLKQHELGNQILQSRLNDLLQDSSAVRYLYSRLAKVNNGIYALMDLKGHNTERLIELHNIVSEGVHKVDDVEENVSALFLALMNPEDRANIQEFPSISDRIETIKIPYVLDLKTEVEIYRNIFGKHIEESFLPRVLHNFARAIIATRLNPESEAMREWIRNSGQYRLSCDDNLLLLKMEIYTGYIPTWLTDEDRRRLNAKRRRKIIAESEKEGGQGLSGRDSIKIFNEFFSTYSRKDQLINMSVLCAYFSKVHPELGEALPNGFLDSLQRFYDFTVLQEVKESLYYYNEEQIAREIQNYLFAINFDPGTVQTCRYTGDRLEISEHLLTTIEQRLLGTGPSAVARASFRESMQKEYTSRTLTQEILAQGLPITETSLYRELFERYVYNLKEKVLDPFLDNENFRRAIKDFDSPSFKTYEKKIRDDVTFLLANLGKKYRYTPNGAREVCTYVIDNDLARKYVRS